MFGARAAALAVRVRTGSDGQHCAAVGPGHPGLSPQEAAGGERETRPDFRRPGEDDRGKLVRRGSSTRARADVIVLTDVRQDAGLATRKKENEKIFILITSLLHILVSFCCNVATFLSCFFRLFFPTKKPLQTVTSDTTSIINY